MYFSLILEYFPKDTLFEASNGVTVYRFRVKRFPVYAITVY